MLSLSYPFLLLSDVFGLHGRKKCSTPALKTVQAFYLNKTISVNNLRPAVMPQYLPGPYF
jgi:hypothetical protein